MNKDKAAGKLDQAVGKVKTKVGEAVGNQKMANSGTAQQVKGAAKETWGNAKDTASSVSDTARTRTSAESADLEQRTENAGHDIRAKVASTARNVKDSINDKLDDVQRDQRHEREDIRQVH